MRVLRRVIRHLSLPPFMEEEWREARTAKVRDELHRVEAAHGLPSAAEMADVRHFYSPFNVKLAQLLGDDAFLWRPAKPQREKA